MLLHVRAERLLNGTRLRVFSVANPAGNSEIKVWIDRSGTSRRGWAAAGSPADIRRGTQHVPIGKLMDKAMADMESRFQVSESQLALLRQHARDEHRLLREKTVVARRAESNNDKRSKKLLKKYRKLLNRRV